MIRAKYLGSKPLSQARWNICDSHFWAGLMSIKNEFQRYGKFMIKDGSQVRFWEDQWVGSSPLSVKFPNLYHIVRKKFDTLECILRSNPPVIPLRRDLTGIKLVEWNRLCSLVASVRLSRGVDEFCWQLTANGKFSVRTFYEALLNSDGPSTYGRIWRIKAPLKIRIFLWYLRRKVIIRCVHWLRSWMVLQKAGLKLMVETACLRLEAVLRECFARLFGWCSGKRLEAI